MPLLPPGPSMLIVGSKPARPHFVSDQLRVEVWGGPNGEKLPVMRLRNEQCGSIAIMSHDELVAHRDACNAILDSLESGAAAQAKGFLDEIVAKAKSQPKKSEEGESND